MLNKILRRNQRAETPQTFVPHCADPDLDAAKIPRHVAIIMDGNGRWAQNQGKPRTFGHAAGARVLRRIVEYADSLGIEALTAYAFSTENWKRPVTEVRFIMNLLVEYLTKELDEFKKYQVRMRFLGSREGLPEVVLEKMDEAVEDTKNNTGIQLNVAINYGGQDEILHAVREIAAEVKEGSLAPDQITKEIFENHLYTRGLPMPDLLIRTGGDLRVSNFLLWQIAYSEIWTTPTYWPDFSEALFKEAILSYQKRDRRFGGLSKKKGK
ncbi:MAG: isoprenyl transferase [Acidaminococcus sp.]|nr:isoprenyl transferase [Acidaminococcus sp.]MCI2099995.1 isoprenyl transferase [Acidaminococcus sp.]MCI2114271.1 isoprenyl transferase [Acidaminococcus sp.]MCI2116215.1 isoprenyl transferase [Acidaminococcus sp.]